MTRAEARALAIAQIERRRVFWRRAREAIPTMKTPPLEGPIDDAEIAPAMFDVIAFRGARLDAPGALTLEVVDAMPEGPRTWFVVAYADGDVRNGGFWQYFGNPTGDLTTRAIAALRAIGASPRADLFAEAATVLFADGVPDHAGRRAVLGGLAQRPGHDAIGAALDAVEARYFALEDEDPLAPHLLAFASACASDFFLDP